jgi:AcrR family transcriptional regulator
MVAFSDQTTLAPRGRHGLPADLVAAHQRERILAACVELVAKRGYRGTSVDQIVKRARVGHAAFHELFSDKEECFCVALERIVAETRESIVAAVSAGASWPEQACATLRALLERIAAEPLRARIVLAEAQSAGEAAQVRHEELLKEAASALAGGRALGEDGEPLPAALEVAIAGGVQWLLHEKAVRGELAGAEEMFDELALIVLEPYLGGDAARALIKRENGAGA